MRALLKRSTTPFVCLRCSRSVRISLSIFERTIALPPIRHASTNSSAVESKPHPRTPKFPRHVRSHLDRHPQTRKHINPDDIEAFSRAVASKNPDPYRACEILEQLVANHSLVDTRNFHLLSSTTGQLLETLLLDYTDVSGLPRPETIVDWCDRLGLRPHAHYDMLLIRAISQEKPVEDIFPLFEAAVRSRIGVRKDQDLVIDTIARNPFLTARQSNKDGRVLFITYVYLRWKGCEFTGPMKDLDTQIYLFNPQDVIESIAGIVQHLPSQLGTEITKASSDLILRPLLQDPAAMRGRLLRYTERNDLDGLKSFYRSLRALEPSPLTEHHYAHLIGSFVDIWRSRETVLEVWDDMINLGIQPSVSSWTSLLRFSKNLPSRTALMDIWNRMIEAGVTPDVHAWTTRITLQMEHKDFAEGLKSFDAMVEEGVRPSAKTINAIISRLSKHGRMDIAARVLAIAEQLNISPDVATYNTVLQDAFQKGNVSAAIEILRAMVERGLEPDFVTFTILINGLGKNKNSLPICEDEASVDIALRILSFMRDMGFAVKVQTYTALLQYLLEQKPVRHDTITAVIHRMRQDKVRPNAKTYTIFIHAAFERGDLAAVNDYWQEMKNTRVWRDHVLWTETILGFAQAGDLIRTEELLNELHEFNRHSGGSRPKVVITLGGYSSLLLALERRGEFNLARRIAQDVVRDWNSRLVADHNWTGGQAEWQWWSLIEKIGGRRYAMELKKIADRGSTSQH